MRHTIAVILLLFGMVAMIYGAFAGAKVLNPSPLLQTREEPRHSIPVTPIAGALALVAGGALASVNRSMSGSSEG